jgi:SNF2 family DNA or RNA helicase
MIPPPNQYDRLKQVRQAENLQLKKCAYIKDSVVLRNYQAIGVYHLLALPRCIIGDATGLGKCQVGSTKIVTSKGLMTLKEAFDLASKEPVSEDTFLDLEGLNVAADGKKMADKVYYGGKKPTIKFETRLGLSAQATPTHRWKVMTEEGGLEWRKTSELKVGDYVAVGRGANVWGTNKVDIELAWMLGVIIGDGHCNTYKNRNKLQITNVDKVLSSRFWEAAKKHFANPRMKTVPPRKEGYLSQFSICEVGDSRIDFFAKKCGLSFAGSAETTIPTIIQGAHKKAVCAFLQGYFDTDGYVFPDGTVQVTSASRLLLEQVQLYLLNIGIVAGLSSKFNKKYQKDYYTLNILDLASKKKFHNWIGFTIESKKQRLKETVYKQRSAQVTYDVLPFQNKRTKEILKSIPAGMVWAFKNVTNAAIPSRHKLSYAAAKKLLSFEHEEFFQKCQGYQELKEMVSLGYFFTQIRSIEDGGVEEVYDLSVPDGNTYVANGMISHNTCQILCGYAYLKEKEPDLKLLVVASKSALYQWASEADKFLEGVKAGVVASGEVQFTPESEDWGKIKIGKIEKRDKSGKPTKVEIDLSLEKIRPSNPFLTAANVPFFKRGKIADDNITSLSLTGKASRLYQLNRFMEQNSDILVVNYNTLIEEHEEICQSLGKFMVVFDEASYFKSTNTLTFRAVSETSRKAARAYGLSATIIKNRLEEAYSIYKAIIPQLFGNATKFKEEYCKVVLLPMVIGGVRRKIPKVVGYKNLTQFRQVIDPYFLGRKKEDVAKELPVLISKEVLLDMTEDQVKAYKDALEGLLVLDTGEEKKVEKVAALIYCQQISNSPHLVGIAGDSSKEEELFRLLEEDLIDEKVIVFTNFKKMIDRFEQLFAKKKIKMTRITGDESAEQRNENKNLFQNPDSGVNVIFINRAGSESINLQVASTFIFFDNPWSYGDYLQLVGRAQRIGSSHSSILVLHLLNRKTIDEYVLKTLKKKQGLVASVFGETQTGELSFDGDITNTLFNEMVQAVRNK